MKVVFAFGLLLTFVGLRGPLLVHGKDQVSAEQIKEFMKEHGYKNNLTYNQISEWFRLQQQNHTYFENFPRLFTLCTTANGTMERAKDGEFIQRFIPIFKEMERNPRKFYDYLPANDSITQNKDWINNVGITRINSPEPDMVNMRQWFHVTINNTEKLQGVFVQTVVGPLGLPFGDFSVDFNCKDSIYPEGNSLVSTIGQISYCSFRPRAGIQHPGVYIGYSEQGADQFHVHFRWSDITCMETPYMQFIIIAVRKFPNPPKDDFIPEVDVHFKPLLSPVYLNTKFDSRDGAAYPYYPTWENQMSCYLNKARLDSELGSRKSSKPGADNEFAELNWEVSLNLTRIQPNEDYDQCVRGLQNKDKDMERFECPPGPFQCDESLQEKDKSNKSVAETREEYTLKETVLSQCFPCVAPSCGPDLGFDLAACGQRSVAVNNSDFLDEVNTAAAGRQHAVLAMFAFFVLMTVANFMGRFFRDVGKNFLCGNGPWLFVHVIAHIASLGLMWLSIGPVAPALADYQSVYDQCFILVKEDLDKAKDCAFEKSLANPHVVMGIMAFIIQHFVLIFGFCRAAGNFLRTIQVALHSHIGYFTFLLGGISSIIGSAYNACGEALVFNILLFLIPLIFFGVGVALDCMTDTKIGIVPRRKQWPVLEPIKIEGKDPTVMLKWIAIGVMAGLQVIIWVLAFIGYEYTVFSGNQLLKKVESINATSLEQLKLPSIFGECSGGYLQK